MQARFMWRAKRSQSTCRLRLPLRVLTDTCGFFPFLQQWQCCHHGYLRFSKSTGWLPVASILPFTHYAYVSAVCFEVVVDPYPWVEAASLKVLLMPPPGLHRLCLLLDLEWQEVYVALASHCLQLVSPRNRPRPLYVGGLFGKWSKKFWWVNGEERKSRCGVLTNRLVLWLFSTQSP